MKFDMPVFAPYTPNYIDKVVAALVRDDNGVNIMVLLKPSVSFGLPHRACIMFWEGDPTPEVCKLDDNYITVEEWCADHDYTMLKVFAEYKDFNLTYSAKEDYHD